MIYEPVGRKQLFPGTSKMKYLITVIFLIYYCLRKSSYKKKKINFNILLDVKSFSECMENLTTIHPLFLLLSSKKNAP